ncbi:MAG: cell division-specific peptidoglycan biosynthesis regulator FtsW [Thermoleophilia bacterium]|nr:cell division-specific peptidoglycan biosynthesis regulator FtsW [Thermoleophilia bacterium]
MSASNSPMMAGAATRRAQRDDRRKADAAASARAATKAAAKAAPVAPIALELPKVSPVTAALGRRRLVVLVALTLYVFGLVMVASASSGEELLRGNYQWALLQKQAIYGFVGLCAMWVAMRMPLDLVRRLARPMVWICVALVVAVMIPGVGVDGNGATRWINLGFFQLQPSEPLKLAVIAMIAAHLSRTAPPVHWMRDFVRSPGGVGLGLAGVLVGVQSDLGSGLVVGASTVVLYVLAGTRWDVLWRTIGPALALVILSIVTEDYRRQRFFAFVDPWANPEAGGYQLVQALIAIGSGGPFGVGLGHSVQKITFLPEAHTDMIFAITVEELGFFGVIMVLGSFSVLAAVGTRIAMRARTRFSALLAAGITAMVVGQAAVNIAGVTGVMPLTGIPLPLVSYGGSSLIMTLVSLGLLANIATERRPPRSFTIEQPEVEAFDIDDYDEDFEDAHAFDDEDDHTSPEHDGTDEPAPAGAGRRGRNRRAPRTGARRR